MFNIMDQIMPSAPKKVSKAVNIPMPSAAGVNTIGAKTVFKRGNDRTKHKLP